MRNALAVGIDNYDKLPLSGCAEDADAFAGIMRRHADGSKNFTVEAIKNVATKGELRTLIRKLFTAEGEMSLFYFSGHGLYTKDGGYILTPDYVQGDPGISMNEILVMANQSPAINKIILLDC